ncbi:MAG: hypothetical protein QXM53_08965, partial [Thermofilaceae archaeon]
MTIELSARQKDSRIDLFSKGEFVSKDFICAGLFYNNNSFYLENMAKIAKKFISKKEPIDKLNSLLKEFLENLNYSVPGKAIYSRDAVNKWTNLLKVINSDQKIGFYRKGKNERFNVVELDLDNTSEIQRYAGIVFLKIAGYEDCELTEELKYDLRLEVLENLLEVVEDQWVKEYLKKVKKMLHNIKEGVHGAHCYPPFSTLAFYLFPINFERFKNVILVSSVSMYDRKLDTKQNLWQELCNSKDFIDLKNFLEEEGKGLEELEELLDQAFKKENLTKLRKEWLKFIQKVQSKKIESKKLESVFLRKKNTNKNISLSYGFYQVPTENLELVILYENEKDKQQIEVLKNKLENFKYAGNIKITVKVGSIYQLFGNNKEYFEILKGWKNQVKERETQVRGGEIEHQESLKLLSVFMYFIARLNEILNFNFKKKQKESLLGVLLLLDMDYEKEKYVFWDIIKFLYSYYNLPFQTITKHFLSSFKNDATIKNMLISLYKDLKKLSFNFSGFELPQEVRIYVIIEKPSPSFFYERDKRSSVSAVRHYLYEVYTIEVKGNEASVWLDNKFFVMCDRFGDVDKMKRYIEEKVKDDETRFYFISALKDGYAKMFYKDMCSNSEFEKKAIFVRYEGLKTTYISQRADNDCLIIYTQQFKEIAKRLGIDFEKENTAAIAIKPARPPKEFEDVYHPTLQVFFTEKIGWSSDEVYSQQHNLLLFTLLALSMYGSESFQVPYSKLNLHSKEKNIYLKIKRKTKDNFNKYTYTFPLKAVVYEMLEFFRHLPYDE